MLRQNTLFLETNLECKISPVAIMSILNHHQRRPYLVDLKDSNEDFVVGFLFGKKKDGIIYISESFPILLNRDPKNDNQISMNAASIRQTLKLHKVTNPSDSIVGWYKTGLNINYQSVTIHEYLSEFSHLPIKLNTNAKKKKTDIMLRKELIALCVDTNLTNNSLSIQAYNALPVTSPLAEKIYQKKLKDKKKKEKQKKTDDSKNANDTKEDEDEEDEDDLDKPVAVMYKFIEIPSSYYATESEKIGIDMIINAPPDDDKLDSPAELLKDMNELEMTLQELLGKLENVEQHVGKVVNGKITSDKMMGWAISETLSSVPSINPEKFEEMLSSRLQDLLMLVYLGKLTKSQCTISDKINNVLHKTIPQ